MAGPALPGFGPPQILRRGEGPPKHSVNHDPLFIIAKLDRFQLWPIMFLKKGPKKYRDIDNIIMYDDDDGSFADDLLIHSPLDLDFLLYDSHLNSSVHVACANKVQLRWPTVKPY